MDNRLDRVIRLQDELGQAVDNAYLDYITSVNESAEAILNNDLGRKFVYHCGRDIAGEVVRAYFDASDYYLTVDQLASRILHFSYENEYDPLGAQTELRKNVYNYNDIASSTLDSIGRSMEENTAALFETERQKDYADTAGRKAYRDSRVDENGNIYDELTGRKGEQTTVVKNGKEELRSDMHADHIQAREAATYNRRFVTEKGAEELRDFMNSADNMQIMHASANTSKGDIRVCKVNGSIVYKNTKESDYDPSTDITARATPEQLADAACSRWEKTGEPDKTQKLKEKGYLNEDGKVPRDVRNKLVANYRRSQNKESAVILKNTNYGAVAVDAGREAAASFGKILAGQVIYYAAPPLIYEAGLILKQPRVTLDEALARLSESAKRIGRYLFAHLRDIFRNVFENVLKKFIKTFMDILVGLVKATVKKLLKIAKSVLLSVVDSIRVITSRGMTPAQKADAVFSLFSVTVTNIVVELLFELLTNAVHLPDFLLNPLRILVSVVCTNFVTLILDKADLFNVRTGFKIVQLEELFERERGEYHRRVDALREANSAEINAILNEIKRDCAQICEQLSHFDPHSEAVRPQLQKISEIFNMNIDFEKSWNTYLRSV